jgi:hypothetical protein
MNSAYEEIENVNIVDSICVINPLSNNIFTLTNPVVNHWLAPNPFSTSTTLSIIDRNNDYYVIKVLDVLGNTLISYDKRKDKRVTIDCKNLPQGVYFLHVQGNQWQFADKLIIK